MVGFANRRRYGGDIAGAAGGGQLVRGEKWPDLPLVLVIDDDIDIRDSIAELLRVEGFEVVTACDGGDALSFLREAPTRVGVILLDLMMPNVDGWTFRRQQLDDGAIAHIPVVVMTAYADLIRGRPTLAASDFLIKPIELHTLLNVVQRYCCT